MKKFEEELNKLIEHVTLKLAAWIFRGFEKLY